YTEALIGRGDISVDEAEKALKDFSSQMEHVFNEVRELEKHPALPSPSVESEQPVPAKVSTAITTELVAEIGDSFVNVPEGFSPHPRVKPVMERRTKMSREGGIDWAFGELLAFGSLVAEGRTVRLAGQDSRRGTFTQRHSVLIDRKTGAEYTPLGTLARRTDDERLGKFLVYDSALSEYAAVGFEYGYSVSNPEAMVCWEAQFGDFVNGAQSVIDEYISSSEAKWGQRSDVVLMLPHGQEGQGPDHSSGRIERFLQLCAEGSMTVSQPSTPGNYFHLLRRHVLDGVSRPLIVFTPKSMLRNKAAVSPLEDFTGTSKFRSVIDDPRELDAGSVRRVLLTSGKVYYELASEAAKQERTDIAILRLEQYYPLPLKKLDAALQRYPNATDIRWVQEEPENQGAWPFLGLHLPRKLPERLSELNLVSRRAMSAPASGSAKVHEVEQRQIVDQALE
ncbi:MAG: multifunctional oxoglutarate decarboxylase/oxoglutarate dehydrogenase thiamine pyrophosphate-binding subunit/dihydrolipoyllysine-residue succinyltransferase subunit, partial [Sciscionella sp.]